MTVVLCDVVVLRDIVLCVTLCDVVLRFTPCLARCSRVPRRLEHCLIGCFKAYIKGVCRLLRGVLGVYMV